MKFYLYILFVFFTIFSFGQDKKDSVVIPQIVLTKFNKMFPNATEIDWHKDGKAEINLVATPYNVFFKLPQKTGDVMFSKNAETTYTQLNISDALIPQTILGYMTKNYKNFITREQLSHLQDSDEIRKKKYSRNRYWLAEKQMEVIDEKGTKHFYFKLIHGIQTYYVLFDSNGNFIEKGFAPTF